MAEEDRVNTTVDPNIEFLFRLKEDCDDRRRIQRTEQASQTMDARRSNRRSRTVRTASGYRGPNRLHRLWMVSYSQITVTVEAGLRTSGYRGSNRHHRLWTKQDCENRIRIQRTEQASQTMDWSYSSCSNRRSRTVRTESGYRGPNRHHRLWTKQDCEDHIRTQRTEQASQTMDGEL
ncbi:hypothetical protein J6590_085742 [Homalodisca vitripennis]|nr:hypothetical protein J6590_085742 [Homalodisca vitripennis]